MNGCHFAPYFLCLLQKKKMKKDISKIKLKTQVGNIVLPYQGTTTGQIWALDHKLCVVHGHNLVIWLWNPFMFIDDRPSYDANFCKLWQISGLSFLISTSGHNRIPCQRNFFFEFAFTFFEFFVNFAKMPSMAIHSKGSNFPKLWTFLWNNQPLCA